MKKEASRKNHSEPFDFIDMLLQKVSLYEKQILKAHLGKQNITAAIYRGKDFIINDSLLINTEDSHTWQHYNNPGWIEFSFSMKGAVFQSQSGLFDHQRLPEGNQHFLFNPASSEENTLPEKGEYRTISIYISIEKAVYLFNEYLPEFAPVAEKLVSGKPFFLQSPDRRFSDRVANILYHLWEAPEQEQLKKLYYESVVNELFCLQWESVLKQPMHTRVLKLRESDVEKLHYAARVLSGSLQEWTSLEWLARECGLNEYKLKAGFKQLFGTTVHGYQQNLRLEKAQQLIRETDKTMTEIAYELGYAHSQHFQRAFKTRFGIAPNGLRK